MDIYAWILALGIVSGQLIRLPFLSGGITILDIAVLFLTLFGLLKLKFRLKNPPFFRSALFFILIALFSLLLTPLHLTLDAYIISFSYIARLFLYSSFAWIIFSLKKDLSKSFIFSGIVIAVLGLLQIIFLPDLRFLANQGWDPHYFRTVSTFLDPNFTGAFLVLTMILLLQLKKERFSILIFALIYFALLTTFSRSSYLMFLSSGLTFSFLNKSKKYLFLTLILFAFLLLGFKTYSILVAAPRNIDRAESASFRFSTWQQGLTLFQKYPVLGIGFNAYRFGINQYNLGDQQFLESHGSSGNDSSLLFVAVTTGIIGLLVYLYFLFSLMKSSKIITAVILGLIVHSFFSNSLFYPPILVWILIISAAPKK